MDAKILRLSGHEARKFLNELSSLRLKVFWEFPYLYEGSLDYEKEYLETYFSAKHSRIILIESEGMIVGATTAIWANEEVESFKQPFLKHGLDPKTILYFGESILLPKWRGKGIGKIFFKEREAYAEELTFIEKMSFCAVRRPLNHPLAPKNYRPLDEFWLAQGYRKEKGLSTDFEWKDRHEDKPTKKILDFWLKDKKDIADEH